MPLLPNCQAFTILHMQYSTTSRRKHSRVIDSTEGKRRRQSPVAPSVPRTNMRVSHPLILLFLFSSVISAKKEIRAGFWPPFSNSYAPPSSIDTSLYTHIFYAFLGTKSINTDFTVSREELPLLTTFSTTLKTKNPSIKTLLSIGGFLSNSTQFSTVAADGNQRKAFIDNSVGLARAHGFDGLDFAWEFPASPEDMDNLGILLTEWKTAIEEEAQNSPPLWSSLLLTTTVYFSNHLLAAPTGNLYYPVEAIAQSVDWVNTMCFDYQGSNREEQGHTKAYAALLDPTSQFSTSYGIDSWMDAGLPPNKLVMGIPLYGRSWILKNKEKNGIGAAAVAFGPRQRLSNQTGIMAYSEIQKFLRDKDATLMYDNATVSAYSYAGDLWVSFDSQRVVEEKVTFAKQNRLLGYFLWPISFDSNYSLSMAASHSWMTNFPTTNLDEDEPAPAPSELPRIASPPSLLSLVGATKSGSESSIFHFNCDLHLLLLLCFI